jgi:hypothetical protein
VFKLLNQIVYKNKKRFTKTKYMIINQNKNCGLEFNSKNEFTITHKLKTFKGTNLAIIKTTPTIGQLKTYLSEIRSNYPDLIGYEFYHNEDFIQSTYTDESTISILSKYDLMPESFFYLYSMDTNKCIINKPFTEILNIDIEEGLISTSSYNDLYDELYNFEGKLIDAGKNLILGQNGLYYSEPSGCSWTVVFKHFKSESLYLFCAEFLHELDFMIKAVNYDYLFDDLKIEDAFAA